LGVSFVASKHQASTPFSFAGKPITPNPVVSTLFNIADRRTESLYTYAGALSERLRLDP
jgi:hypothetical protein